MLGFGVSWGCQEPAGVLVCPFHSQPWAQGNGNSFSLLLLGRNRDGKPFSEKPRADSMLGVSIYCLGHAAPVPHSLHAPSPAEDLIFGVCI